MAYKSINRTIGPQGPFQLLTEVLYTEVESTAVGDMMTGVVRMPRITPVSILEWWWEWYGMH